MQITIVELDPKIGTTGSGVPQRGIKCRTNGQDKWVRIRGDGLDNLQLGQDLIISEPTQFKKSWYTVLEEIRPMPEGPKTHKDIPHISYAKTEWPIPWELVLDAYSAAIKYALNKAELNPELQSIIVGGIMMGIRDGKIGLPPPFQVEGDTKIPKGHPTNDEIPF